MTHIRNIPHILRYGITHGSSPNANPEYIAIGDSEIIRKRSVRAVSTVTGESFVTGDYIPFYFYARMPMLYNIQHGYNVKKTNPEDIVYLIVPLDAITSDPTRQYFFSDGHAVFSETRFYGKESIDKMDEILDVDAILESDWNSDYLIRERKQAEFLIKGDIPTDLISAVCCYNEEASVRLDEMGVRCRIIISKKAYY